MMLKQRLFGLLSLLLFHSNAQVIINDVSPTLGSLFGGTRLVIRGSGFSTKPGTIPNVVVIGSKYFCKPIPLECSYDRIVCKTFPALDGFYDTYELLQTFTLPVTVSVDSVLSTCSPSVATKSCTFLYTTTWIYTPRLDSISPSSVTAGSMVTVSGRFYKTLLSDDAAPQIETPLSAVKVTSQIDDQVVSDLFGSTGYRCMIFNPATEEYHPNTISGDVVTQFSCKFSGARESGRYNMSVAILGAAATPDSNMNMGESMIFGGTYIYDHKGVGYLLQQSAVVTDFTPKVVGTLGGAAVTIIGEGFSSDPSRVRVEVSGTACNVRSSSPRMIICELAPLWSPVMDYRIMSGSRGIRSRIWYNLYSKYKTLDQFVSSPHYKGQEVPDMSWEEQFIFEAPRNIQSARGDPFGPIGHFVGFFHPPRTSNYTFLSCADDFSRVLINLNRSNLSKMEKILDITDWSPHRDWGIRLFNPRVDLGWSRMNDLYLSKGYDPATSIIFSEGRRSRKLALSEGDRYYMEAMYLSGVGGDNFAIGAIMHNTDLNRRDSPAALDEQQLIGIEAFPSYEMHNLTLISATSSGLRGTFTLSLGGKQSRPIAVDSSAAAVGAAVRELLSNCEGDVGDERDGVGGTFDCFQGIGAEYRGLWATTVSNLTCLPWSRTPNYHAYLKVSGGIDGNLCRNPSLDVGSYPVPWCWALNSKGQTIKEQCSVPRCGGAVANSLVTGFEDEEELDGLHARTNTWDAHLGVVPSIARDQAFCGRASLFLPNAFSVPRWSFRRDLSKRNALFPYSVVDYPYICLAYKLPPTSQAAIQLGFTGGADTSGVAQWRTLSFTDVIAPSYAPELARFDSIRDNQWHYTCLNVYSSPTLGGRFYVADIRFRAEGLPTSSYAKNPMWIDEFSISKTLRRVSPTAFPDLGGRAPPRLVSVTRVPVSGGLTWSIALTGEDCSVPNAKFVMDTSGVSGPVKLASVVLVRNHSQPLGGQLAVSFGGEETIFGPYSDSATVKANLQSLSTVGDVLVRRSGTCQSGFHWLVTFTNQPGDLPPMQVRTEALVGAHVNASVTVYPVTDGGLLMAPIPADYFHLPVAVSNLQVYVNDGLARCGLGNQTSGTMNVTTSPCSFNFSVGLNAQVTTVTPLVGDKPSLPIYLITGSKLSSVGTSDFPQVSVGGVSCNVLDSSDSTIRCQISRVIASGTQTVKVVIPGRGLAQGSLSVVYPLGILSVEPRLFSAFWPTILKVSGYGFNDVDPLANVLHVNVPLGDDLVVLNCTTLNATVTEVFCLTEPAPVNVTVPSVPSTSGRRDGTATDGSVVGQVNGQSSTLDGSQSVVFVQPVVYAVFPTLGSSGGGTLLTVQGEFFSDDPSANLVLVGSVSCQPVSSSSTEIVCSTPPNPMGLFPVTVYIRDTGIITGTSFQYKLLVSQVTPSYIGTGGSTSLTVTGSVFPTQDGRLPDVYLQFPAWSVFVVSVYAPVPITEVTDIAVRGVYVNCIQQIFITSSTVQSFYISLYSAASPMLSRSTNNYALQAQVESLLPQGGTARVTRDDSGVDTTTFTVEFRGGQGDVPLMQVFGCAADALTPSDCKLGLGVASSLVQVGRAPTGAFLLGVDGTTTATWQSIPVFSTAASVQALVASLPVAGGMTVEYIEGSDGPTWRITFNTLQSTIKTLGVALGSLSGATVTATRMRKGTTPPTGTFQLALRGVRTTRTLNLQSTEDDVLTAIMEMKSKWDDVRTVEVLAGDGFPGNFFDRSYPRQWIIRMERLYTSGRSIQRCTIPTYINWDPSACPNMASDLYLANFPYYWPALLPKPADLETEAYRATMQAACDAEARTQDLTLGGCEAPQPQETAPICGVGSGVHPPCWVNRWTVAQVAHQNGDWVVYERDESMDPSDRVKGYRFWRVQGGSDLSVNDVLQLQNVKISTVGTGVQLNVTDARVGQKVPVQVVSADDSSMMLSLPSLGEFRRSYGALLKSDVFFKPSSLFRGDRFQLMGFDAPATIPGVTPTAAPLDDGMAASFSSQADSSALLLQSTSQQFLKFTLDLWVRVAAPTSADDVCAALVRGVSPQGISFAVSVCGSTSSTSPRFQFWLNVSVAQSLAQFSSIDGSFGSFGEWVHLAAMFNGNVQRIYGGGSLVSQRTVVEQVSPANISLLVLSLGCAPLRTNFSRYRSTDPFCQPSNPFLAFDGQLDWVLWYPFVLSPAAISTHGRFLKRSETVSVKAKYGAILSECDGCELLKGKKLSRCSGCEVALAPAITPAIWAVDPPQRGTPGSNLVLFGRFPSAAGAVSVSIDGNDCPISALSDTQITCAVPQSQALGAAVLSVFVQSVGQSSGFAYSFAPIVTAVGPVQGGSIIGGSTITIQGAGLLGLSGGGPGNRILVGSTLCRGVSDSWDQAICVVDRRGLPAIAFALVAEVEVTVNSVAAIYACDSSSIGQTYSAGLPPLSSWAFLNCPTAPASALQPVSSKEVPANSALTGTGVCRFVYTLDYTPVISSVSTPDSLLDGVLLPGQRVVLNKHVDTDRHFGEAEVLVGQWPSPSSDASGSSVTSILSSQASGGVHTVWLRFASGFGLRTGGACAAPQVSVVPLLTSVSPSTVSSWGGAMVTLSGSAFSPSAVLNRVVLGGSVAQVLSASTDGLVVSLPATDLAADSQSGLERFTLSQERCAATDGAKALCDASAASALPGLDTCFSSLVSSRPSWPRRVATVPASAQAMALLDSDPTTIWTQAGVEAATVLIDLGLAKPLGSLVVRWAGNLSAASYQVTTSSTCNQSDARVAARRALCMPTASGRNLAFSCGDGTKACPATQLSTNGANTASRALDGNNKTSCAVTNTVSLPWWRVDLNATRNIRGGRIWNRVDGTSEALDGFEVWVGRNATLTGLGNSLCYTAKKTPVTLFTGNANLYFDCVATGRYLYIKLPRTASLSVCELEVFEAVSGCVAPVWDLVDVLPLTGFGRFIRLQLQQFMPNKQAYAIRDIQVLGPDASGPQSVTVTVGSVEATCANPSSCLLTFDQSARITSISPTSGSVGQQIAVVGSGFPSDCSVVTVNIGPGQCELTYCSPSMLQCTLPDEVGGVYPLTVTTSKGRAQGTLPFTYLLRVDAVSPSQAGVGGGQKVQLSGRGFDSSGSGTVKVCGFAADANSPTPGLLQLSLPPLINVPQAPKRRGFTVPVAEDVLAFPTAFCRNYTLSSNVKTCNCEDEDWMCYRARYLAATTTKADATYNWRYSSTTRWWGCSCTGAAGTVLPSSPVLGFDIVTGSSYFALYSPQAAYLRFTGVDLAPSSAIISAVLRVFTSTVNSCPAGSAFRVWAEAAGNSSPFDLSQQGSMTSRPLTNAYVDWTVGTPWLWAYQQYESDNLSPVLAEVISRPGWKSGNAITLVVRQLRSGNGQCRFLAMEAGDAFAPQLGIAISETPVPAASLLCDVEVVPPPSLSAYLPPRAACNDPLTPVLSVIHPTLGDIPQAVNYSWVPRVAWACCEVTGQPALYALDGDTNTFWRAGRANTAVVNFTVDLGACGAAVTSARVVWTVEYSQAYQMLASADGDEGSWEVLYSTESGTGGVEEFSLAAPRAGGRIRYVRLSLLAPASATQAAYGVNEFSLFGCGQCDPKATTISAVLRSSLQGLASLSPSIRSISPSMGSTAGGTTITVRGDFLGAADSSTVSIDLGGLPCAIVTLQASSDGASDQEAVCQTSASGLVNGGYKYARVVVSGASSPLGQNALFWYIDAWSSLTTWGGASPPTGCADYVVDPGCKESVVIPEGQIVLLDVSPPRLFLLLIEGTLVFDRTDLHLQASYILVRGGRLQIGTEEEPFLQSATISLFGHPKSVDLPIFGASVLACYQCHLDLHGAPTVSWTQLANTASPGDTVVRLTNPVTWAPGSKIIIATTDFESPMMSHTEVATVAEVREGGYLVALQDIGVCSSYTESGIPTDCTRTDALTWPHLGESRSFDGRTLEYRAEVGLLTRNIVIQGGQDGIQCPYPSTADDGVTLLACNQFSGHIMMHSPGHESLVARFSNVEIRNVGQAARLGRYAVYWYSVGNLRQSFMRNCSIHHSFNRAVAISKVNYLRLQNMVAYHIMGHAFFMEAGVEQYNLLQNNLGVKVLPAMNLLNTDQTPAVFWITNPVNYFINNHAVASRRYGIWYRTDWLSQGASGFPGLTNPTNLPLLVSDGNVAHSNGKYGFRIYGGFLPTAASVFSNFIMWRNAESAWTAAFIGMVGFEGFVASESGRNIFECRYTYLSNWKNCFIRGGFFVDRTGLPVGDSYLGFGDRSYGLIFRPDGANMEAGLLLPWNEMAGGGMVVANTTFVGFQNPCLRGCAHCGRINSPSLGDGGFETRFSAMRFVKSPQRALFRHPNEAFFYDLDGSLTGTGIVENYTSGGIVRGSSFVGTSVLLPTSCTPSAYSQQGTGGSVCTGFLFRRSWFQAVDPSIWVGKALCVRSPWSNSMNRCQSLQPQCNCLPYLKMAWQGNMFIGAEGLRYNLQVDLTDFEMADAKSWRIKVWDVQPRERFRFTHRFLQWSIVSGFRIQLYRADTGNGQIIPRNYFFNTTACNIYTGCGLLMPNTSYWPMDYDQLGLFLANQPYPGNLPMPYTVNGDWTVQPDVEGQGSLFSVMVFGGGTVPAHVALQPRVFPCTSDGCPRVLAPTTMGDLSFGLWSDPATWNGTLNHTANPLNTLRANKVGTSVQYTVAVGQNWSAAIPSDYDDVWIPPWKKVVLDLSQTPTLGRLVIEGSLLINNTDVVLSAVYIDIRGGQLIIAKTNGDGTVVGTYDRSCTINLLGTNAKLSSKFSSDPRKTPQVLLGREGVALGAGMLGVFGTFVAAGRPVSHSWLPLAVPAEVGSQLVVVDGLVDWAPGSEVVITPTGHDPHRSDVRTIVGARPDGAGRTELSLNSALDFAHVAGARETFGTRSMRVRGKVGLLTRNIVIRGEGQGEQLPYTLWNAPLIRTIASTSAGATCGNLRCDGSENSISCPADCFGPTYEYGASVLVSTYTEDQTFCARDGVCSDGFVRTYSGATNLSNVEFRYFGQNGLRNGLSFAGLGSSGPRNLLSNLSFNRGYSSALRIDSTSGVTFQNSLIFRSMLPAVEVAGGTGNILSGSLAVIGIFWNTNRGSIQGDGMSSEKLRTMVGLIHDGGSQTMVSGNVAAGSERAGFSGPGLPCGGSADSLFAGNEAHSCLSGFWFDYYAIRQSAPPCVRLADFSAWKIYLYGVYGEIMNATRLELSKLSIADAKGGVRVILAGARSSKHELVDKRVNISNSLFVGSTSVDQSWLAPEKPSLFTCAFYMAWCWHLDSQDTVGRVGVYLSLFTSSSNYAPYIYSWNNGDVYPSIWGRTDLTSVTFARYGQPICTSTTTGWPVCRRNFALAGHDKGSLAADAWHPVFTRATELVDVDPDSRVYFPPPSSAWINPSDCVDMDCDGPKHGMIRDEDGTFLGGSGGSIIARAEVFSPESFFGLPYNDPVNTPVDQSFWYPNLPAVMRTNRDGSLVNVADQWLRGGFGVARSTCSLVPGWNAWSCPTTIAVAHRMLVIENMDPDSETRRISPVALSSNDGYTDLMNGCMDHGWCFATSCQRRLMTFWGLISTNQAYTLHFTGSAPQSLRIHLLHAKSTEGIMLKIYFDTSSRLQVFIGNTFVEDVNMFNGQRKSQLVAEGRWAPNGPFNSYIEQELSLDCGCFLGGTCLRSGAAVTCGAPGDTHGSNRYNRDSGMLEMIIRGHAVSDYIEVRTMPVVQVSMTLSTSVDDFYKVKDTFISNLAYVLRISSSSIHVVDVVAGRRRRERSRWVAIEPSDSHHASLRQLDSSLAMEIVPDAEVGFLRSFGVQRVLETDGVVNFTLYRDVNLETACAVRVRTVGADESVQLTALSGVDYVGFDISITFLPREMSKTGSVVLIPRDGFQPSDTTFEVRIVSTIAAVISTRSLFVAVRNVDPPAPIPPSPLGLVSEVDVLALTWPSLPWPNAPSDQAARPAQWQLECPWSAVLVNRSGVSTADVGVDSSSGGNITVSSWQGTVSLIGVPPDTMVSCRIRALTTWGWSDWSAFGASAHKSSVCGNQLRESDEECDDGNLLAGDGCDVSCNVEPGWVCMHLSSDADTCTQGCGDGVIAKGETCDDGNTRDGDGCSSSCQMELGWTCSQSSNSLAYCQSTCGDGVWVSSTEQCDDGNQISGDGCSPTCTLEPAWSCRGVGSASACQRCGNGKVEGTEVCDDGGLSKACASNCLSIRVGWRCDAMSCTAGPTAPGQPISVLANENQLGWQWSAPFDAGLPVLGYQGQLAKSLTVENASWGTLFNLTGGSWTAFNLSTGTSFMLRVRACSAAGCGPFSLPSFPTSTLPTPEKSLQKLAAVLSNTTYLKALGTAIHDYLVQPPSDSPLPPPPPIGLLTMEEYIAKLAVWAGAKLPASAAPPVNRSQTIVLAPTTTAPVLGSSLTTIVTSSAGGNVNVTVSSVVLGYSAATFLANIYRAVLAALLGVSVNRVLILGITDTAVLLGDAGGRREQAAPTKAVKVESTVVAENPEQARRIVARVQSPGFDAEQTRGLQDLGMTDTLGTTSKASTGGGAGAGAVGAGSLATASVDGTPVAVLVSIGVAGVVGVLGLGACAMRLRRGSAAVGIRKMKTGIAPDAATAHSAGEVVGAEALDQVSVVRHGNSSAPGSATVSASVMSGDDVLEHTQVLRGGVATAGDLPLPRAAAVMAARHVMDYSQPRAPAVVGSPASPPLGSTLASTASDALAYVQSLGQGLTGRGSIDAGAGGAGVLSDVVGYVQSVCGVAPAAPAPTGGVVLSAAMMSGDHVLDHMQVLRGGIATADAGGAVGIFPSRPPVPAPITASSSAQSGSGGAGGFSLEPTGETTSLFGRPSPLAALGLVAAPVAKVQQEDVESDSSGAESAESEPEAAEGNAGQTEQAPEHEARASFIRRRMSSDKTLKP